MPSKLIFAALSMALCATACRDNDPIQTYRVSKETGPSTPMIPPPMMDTNAGDADMKAMGEQMGMKAAATSREIQWKIPTGWKEQPPSSMRVGSFLVIGKNGQTADVSVIPLFGAAGGDLANINRWRDQIGLGPLSEAELPKQSETISAGGRRMRLIDFANSKKRLVAAIYIQGERSWFFKMMGDDPTVAEAKPAFLRFLQSLQFHDQ
jgi:hypothetical protein